MRKKMKAEKKNYTNVDEHFTGLQKDPKLSEYLQDVYTHKETRSDKTKTFGLKEENALVKREH